MMIVFTGISEFHKRNINARRGIQQQSRILQRTGCIFHHLLHEHITAPFPYIGGGSFVYNIRPLTNLPAIAGCIICINTGYQGIQNSTVHRFIRCFRPLFQTFQTYIKAIGSQRFAVFHPPRIRLQHLWRVSLCFRFFINSICQLDHCLWQTLLFSLLHLFP